MNFGIWLMALLMKKARCFMSNSDGTKYYKVSTRLTNFEKKKRKLEREAKKMREEEASRISILSFSRLIESGVLFYTEGNK